MSKHTYEPMKFSVSVVGQGAAESFNISLPELIGLLRRRQNLSASALAKKCEVSRNYVGLIEKGRANPTLTVVAQILGALGYRITFYVEDKDDENSGL